VKVVVLLSAHQLLDDSRWLYAQGCVGILTIKTQKVSSIEWTLRAKSQHQRELVDSDIIAQNEETGPGEEIVPKGLEGMFRILKRDDWSVIIVGIWWWYRESVQGTEPPSRKTRAQYIRPYLYKHRNIQIKYRILFSNTALLIIRERHLRLTWTQCCT
jgi:hypothetical protein